MTDHSQEIRDIWKDNRKIGDRLGRVEQHLDDHVCVCAERWHKNEKANDAIRHRTNWIIALIVAGLAAIIGMLVNIITGGG